jgi:hypothetical protein
MIAVIGSCTGKHVVDHRFEMQPDRHVDAVANVAEHHREMMHRHPRAACRNGLSALPATVVDIKAVDMLDQRFLALAVGNQIGNRDLLEAMLDRERSPARRG